MSDVFGQKGYCHEHGKYKPCSKCQDVLIDIGIQIDKNRIRELEAMTTWQPIESAPLNGEHVLLWQKYADFPVIAYFSHRRNMWFAETEYYETNGDATVIDTIEQALVTHWMPLPPPPTA